MYGRLEQHSFVPSEQGTSMYFIQTSIFLERRVFWYIDCRSMSFCNTYLIPLLHCSNYLGLNIHCV